MKLDMLLVLLLVIVSCACDASAISVAPTHSKADLLAHEPVIFYVDSITGNNDWSGTSPHAPWHTLARVNRQTFLPDEKVLLRRGCVWENNLILNGRAPATHPITLGTYG
jgi:hypothetical protein